MVAYCGQPMETTELLRQSGVRLRKERKVYIGPIFSGLAAEVFLDFKAEGLWGVGALRARFTVLVSRTCFCCGFGV